MKKQILAIIYMSFLLFAACSSFEQNVTEMASQASMTIPGGTVQLSGNPIWVQASTTRTNVSEQYLLLKVICTTGQIDAEPRILRIKGVSANFNIQSLVNVPFDYEFDYSDLSGYAPATWNDRTGLVAAFTLQVGESYVYNDEYFEEYTAETQSINVIQGKKTNYQIVNEGSFFENYIENTRFLDMGEAANASDNKTVVKSLMHPVKAWLYFYGSAPNVYVDILHTDGTTHTATVTPSLLSDYTLVEYNAHGCAFANRQAGKTIQSYSLRIGNPGTSFLNVEIQEAYTESYAELYMLNQHGVVEVINCYGDLETNAASESETYTLQPKLSPGMYDRTIETESKGNKVSFKINTGYKTLSERIAIQKLLLSPYKLAWLKTNKLPPVTGETWGFVPVNLMPGNWMIDTTSTDIIDLAIEVQIAHIE